jgi:hypothetical protein
MKENKQHKNKGYLQLIYLKHFAFFYQICTVAKIVKERASTYLRFFFNALKIHLLYFNLFIMKTAPFLLILFLIAAGSITAEAQNKDTDAAARFRFGLKGSANINWVKANSKNVENDGARLGYSYGLMGDYNFTDNYAISTEFLITQINANISFVNPMIQSTTLKGDSIKHTFDDAGAVFKIKYVQIPISIKFKTKEIGLVTYWAQFGFAPCFLANAKADYTGVQPVEEYEKLLVNDNANDLYHLVDTKDDVLFNDRVFFMRLPLIIGGGIEYNLSGNTSLYAGLRVDNGFTNTFNKDEKTKANLNYVSITAGIFF